MKIFYLECTDDELRANRGIMDAIVDACSGIMSGLYGTCNPAAADSEKDPEEEEEQA